jgi:hypothetical protein
MGCERAPAPRWPRIGSHRQRARSILWRQVGSEAHRVAHILNQRQAFVTEATASALHVLHGRRRSAASPSAICRQMRKIAEHRIVDRDRPVRHYILQGPSVRLEL